MASLIPAAGILYFGTCSEFCPCHTTVQTTDLAEQRIPTSFSNKFLLSFCNPEDLATVVLIVYCLESINDCLHSIK